MSFYARDIYGSTPVTLPVAQTGVAISATDDLPDGWRTLLSPKNPLFWIGMIGLATVGAAGLAGSVRLGPAKVSGSVGKS